MRSTGRVKEIGLYLGFFKILFTSNDFKMQNRAFNEHYYKIKKCPFLSITPCRTKTSPGFPAISDINQGVRPMKMALIFFCSQEKRDCTIHVAKTKMSISCLVTAQLICAFDFTMCKAGFFSCRGSNNG